MGSPCARPPLGQSDTSEHRYKKSLICKTLRMPISIASRFLGVIYDGWISDNVPLYLPWHMYQDPKSIVHEKTDARATTRTK